MGFNVVVLLNNSKFRWMGLFLIIKACMALKGNKKKRVVRFNPATRFFCLRAKAQIVL